MLLPRHIRAKNFTEDETNWLLDHSFPRLERRFRRVEGIMSKSYADVILSRPVTERTNLTLIEAIAGGSQGAMRTLYDRYSTRVYRFILRIVGNATRAEDLLTEVFIDVWNQAGQFEGRSQVSTWILSIARFTALSAIRTRDEAALDETMMEFLEDSADTPEEAVLKEDRSAQVRRCLAELSREHREVIDLVYYHEKSIEEAADIIRAPKNTVKTRMFYARKRLAQLLSHHCDFEDLALREAA
jgi:RNA polymerase sigma-70 factor (ECF subfamily)